MKCDEENGMNESRKFKTFSDLVGSNTRSVSDLKSLFESKSDKKGEIDMKKTRSVRTRVVTRRKGSKKLIPISGQGRIDAYLIKNDSGLQTPDSGKRKYDQSDEIFNFSSANTPKLKSLRRLGDRKSKD